MQHTHKTLLSLNPSLAIVVFRIVCAFVKRVAVQIQIIHDNEQCVQVSWYKAVTNIVATPGSTGTKKKPHETYGCIPFANADVYNIWRKMLHSFDILRTLSLSYTMTLEHLFYYFYYHHIVLSVDAKSIWCLFNFFHPNPSNHFWLSFLFVVCPVCRHRG